MKIYNIENNTKQLHIQKQDLLILEKLYPKTILSIQNFPQLENNKNSNEFITITNEHDIDLIKFIPSIIDYRYYRILTIKELKEEIKKIKRKNLSKEITKHIIKQLKEIIDIKENNSSLKLPLEIDYYGYHHTGIDENNPYVISTGIDPNTFFFYRKDKMPLTITENLPFSFIENAILINKLQRSKQDEIIISYNENYTITPDQKYFIITIKPKSLNKNKELTKRLKSNLHNK